MDHCVEQFQCNYVDRAHQAGTRGLHYAASKGLAVVVMEPLRGGGLARNIPPAVQSLWDSYTPHPGPLPKGEGVRPSPSGRGEGGEGRTPADWALQWVWNQPEVSLVLSGMTTMEQACPRARPGVEQNLESAGRSGVGTMIEEGLALVAQARKAYQALCAVPCTARQSCLPCPQGVAIPDLFDIYNGYLMFREEEPSRMFCSWIDEKTRAGACIECGECVEKCPQQIRIPEWMKKVHEALGGHAT